MKLIDKIKNTNALIASLKKENLAIIAKNVKNVNSEIENIFDIAVDSKEISYYKLELLNRKVILLENTLLREQDKAKNYIDRITDLRSRKFLVNMIFIISAVPLMLFIPILYWIIYTLYMIYHVFCTRIISGSDEEYEKIEKLCKERENTLVSCKNILNKKLQKSKDSIKQNVIKNDCNLEIQALKQISDYLNGEEIDFISAEIENEIIKILQFELGSEEEDVFTLLNTASKNCNSENLTESFSRARVNSGDLNE